MAVERVQTGVRVDKRLLKVLKALAEYRDMSLGDLLEGIVLHAFEGRCALSKDTLAMVKDLRRVYGLELTAAESHCHPDDPAGDPKIDREAARRGLGYD